MYEYKHFERSDNFENMSIKEMIAKTSKKPRTVAIARILRLNHTPQKNKREHE